MDILSFKNVSKQHGQGTHTTHVLKDIDLTVTPELKTGVELSLIHI